MCTTLSSYTLLKETFHVGTIPAYKHIRRKNSWLKLNDMEINQDNLNNSATTGIFPPSLKYVSSCHDFQPKNWHASHSDGSRVLGLPSSKVWEMKQISPTGELAGLFHRHLLALLHAAAASSPLASRNWLQPANSTSGQVDLLTSGCGPD